jgi:hypothetical protein
MPQRQEAFQEIGPVSFRNVILMTNPNSLLSLQSASSMDVEIHAADRMTAATHHPCAGRTKAGLDAVQENFQDKCSACPADEISVSQPTVDCSSDPSARIVAEFFQACAPK